MEWRCVLSSHFYKVFFQFSCVLCTVSRLLK
jgi:hypothetical protein